MISLKYSGCQISSIIGNDLSSLSRGNRHLKAPKMESSWVDAQESENDPLSDYSPEDGSTGGSDNYDLLSSREMPVEEPMQTSKLYNGMKKSTPGISARAIKKEEHSESLAGSERLMRSSKGHVSPLETSHVVDESQFLMPTLEHTVSHPQPPEEVTVKRNTVRRRKAPREQRMVEKPRNGRTAPATWQETFRDFSAETFSLATDVLQMSIRNLKVPLSYLVTALVMYLTCWLAWAKISGKPESTFSFGVCRVPTLPWLLPSLCGDGAASYARYTNGMPAPPPAEFDRLMASNKHFEEVLASRGESVALPAIMKRSEASMRDLRTLVSVSTLKSRRELVQELDGFVDASRSAVRDLTVFNAHVDRSADFILGAARWTRRVLDDIETERITGGGGGGSHSGSNGGITRSLLSFIGMAPATVEQRVLERYLEHAEAVSGVIQGLVVEAQALDALLLRLEGRLDAIGAIGAREDGAAAAGRDDLLAELWTRLGGNRRRLGRFDAELNVLRQVASHRRAATAQVGDAVLRLQRMQAELEGLRERVAATQFLADAPPGSAASGIPISLHLENIEKGVRRLEAIRDDSNRKFDEFQEKVRAGVAGKMDDKRVAIEST